MTGIYPDWDTINIWMDRDPIPIHEFADGTLNVPVKSGLGQTPDWDVTHTPQGLERYFGMYRVPKLTLVHTEYRVPTRR